MRGTPTDRVCRSGDATRTDRARVGRTCMHARRLRRTARSGRPARRARRAAGARGRAPAQGASRLVVRGAGFGHGVGMSQYGAFGFAEQGLRPRARSCATTTRARRSARSPAAPGARAAEDRQPDRLRLAPRRRGRPRARPGADVRRHARPQRRGHAAQLQRARPRQLRLAAGDHRRRAAACGCCGSRANGVDRRALPRRPRAPRHARWAACRRSTRSASRTTSAASSPARCPSGWPPEALRAQAVAARTYALATSKDGDGFDQYADTRSQVYNGHRRRDAGDRRRRRRDRRRDRRVRGQAGRHVLLLDLGRAHGERRERLHRRGAGAVPDVGRRPLRRRVAAPHVGAPDEPALGAAPARLARQGLAARISVLRRGQSPRVVARPGRRHAAGARRSAARAAPQARALRHLGALHGHHRQRRGAATATRPHAAPAPAAADGRRRAAAAARRRRRRRAARPALGDGRAAHARARRRRRPAGTLGRGAALDGVRWVARVRRAACARPAGATRRGCALRGPVPRAVRPARPGRAGAACAAASTTPAV